MRLLKAEPELESAYMSSETKKLLDLGRKDRNTVMEYSVNLYYTQEVRNKVTDMEVRVRSLIISFLVQKNFAFQTEKL